MDKKSNNGFTLVEIAIVLVVVGLLIGGVLQGRQLMINTKLKRIESDQAGISSAILAYQDRYQELPGDDSGADERFTVYTLGDPVFGNGDGLIDGNWDVASTGDITVAPGTVETNMMFAHLRAANMIDGDGKDDIKPTNTFGGLIGIREGSLRIAGHVVIFGQIEGTISKLIEAKLDDGQPNTGKIQSGIASGAAPIDMNTAAIGSISYDDSERYNIGFQL